MNAFTSWSLCTALSFAANGAIAHHAFSPVYDEGRMVTVEGVVQEFRFVNPHAMMTLEVRDGGGHTVLWSVEFNGVVNLIRRGWTAETFRPGERLTMSGYPTHTGSPQMFFRRATRADGEELSAPALEDGDAIEAQRRQRAQQRESQN
jgi:hypothetical protein